MSTAVEEQSFTQEQSAALNSFRTALGSGYRKTQRAMATIASSIVDLRMTFLKDGKPDYRGETPEYRQAIGRIYEEILKDEDQRSAFKTAIRYWISKEFQARVESGKLDATELFASGIERPSRPKRSTKKAPEPVADGNEFHLDKESGEVTRNGKSLSHKQLRKAAEGVAVEYLADIGPVTMMRSVTSELKALLQALSDPDAGVSPRSSVFRGAVKNLLIVTHEIAKAADVSLEEAIPATTKKRRGRPPGSKNRQKSAPRRLSARQQQQKQSKEETKEPVGTADINWPS